MTYTADSQNLFKPVNIRIGIQHHRILIGFISQKDAQWSKHGTTCPHPHPHDPFTVTCHFISRIVNDIIDDKYQYRYNDRHSQASLTNNTSQRGPDKEEQQTRKGNRYLLMPLRLMFPDSVVISLHRIALESQIASHVFRTANSGRYHLLFLH